MSQGQVYRAHSAEGTFIIKGSPRANEALFYERIAPALRLSGVPMPALLWSFQQPAYFWIGLEDLSEAFPRSRWVADPAVMAALARLHAHPAQLPFELPEMYRPCWDDKLTAEALSLLPPEDRARLKLPVRQLQEQAQFLFEPRCLISGDPNPANWGLRQDGSLALFDWERLSYGTPALDLAITVPGLGSPQIFRQVARVYATQVLHLSREKTPEPATFAYAIALAKVWNVLEFFSMYAREQVKDAPTLERFFQPLIELVDTIVG